MEFNPSSLEHVPNLPQQEKRVISPDEAKQFFETRSFLNFHDDMAHMIETSSFGENEEKRMLTKLESLYKQLENGFDVDDLMDLYEHIVGIPADETEKDIQSYFIYSMKKLYENFRRTHYSQ